MKYWGYFSAKLFFATMFLAGVWPLLKRFLPKPPLLYGDLLLYSAGIYGFWMLAAGLLYLAVWDQRYRCRTCLRRLRMPIARGSWSRLLTGRPHLEYICPYGHGTLKVPELHLTGKEPNDWAEHQDIWTELELLDTGKR